MRKITMVEFDQMPNSEVTAKSKEEPQWNRRKMIWLVWRLLTKIQEAVLLKMVWKYWCGENKRNAYVEGQVITIINAQQIKVYNF